MAVFTAILVLSPCLFLAVWQIKSYLDRKRLVVREYYIFVNLVLFAQLCQFFSVISSEIETATFWYSISVSVGYFLFPFLGYWLLKPFKNKSLNAIKDLFLFGGSTVLTLVTLHPTTHPVLVSHVYVGWLAKYDYQALFFLEQFWFVIAGIVVIGGVYKDKAINHSWKKTLNTGILIFIVWLVLTFQVVLPLTVSWGYYCLPLAMTGLGFLTPWLVNQKAPQKYLSSPDVSQMLQKLGLGTLLFGHDLRLIHINENFSQGFGFSLEKLKGKTPLEVWLSLGVQQSLDMADTSQQVETTMIDAYGYSVSIEISMLKYDDPSSGNTGLIWFLRKTTELQKLEALIVDSQNRFKSLFDAASDALIITDSHFRILECNSATEKTFGYTENQLVGTMVTDFIQDEQYAELKTESVSRIKAYVTRNMSDGAYVLEALKKSGELFSAEFTVSPYTSNGEEYYSIIIRDISARLSVERKLKDKKKELSTYVYRASHDLRGPVASIQGLVHLLVREPDSSQGVKDFVAMIEKSTLKMLTVLEEFQQIAYLTQGTQVRQSFSVKAVVDEAVVSLAGMPESRHVKVVVSGEEDFEILGSRNLLESVIRNVLSNGVKYYDKYKEVPFVRLSYFKTGSELQIVIQDNAIGIHEEIKAKVFNMFYRGSSRSQGAGLGLYIVKEAIELLNGAIELKTETAVGTTVSISLPVHFVENKEKQMEIA